jgi:hypothetical protein
MSWLSRLVASFGFGRKGRPFEGLLGAYLRVRPELLPSSELVFRANDAGDAFLQVCPECRSLDFETGDWLGQAFLCRGCDALLLPCSDGTTRVLATKAWQPRPL